MEKVTGIGGVLVRARDPAALARWYEEHPGVTRTPTEYNAPSWEQDAGPTVFEPFPESSEYFGDPTKRWMLNFRVRDLAAICAQLPAGGVEVTIDPTVYPNGRFARLKYPEGNSVELWALAESASGASPPA